MPWLIHTAFRAKTSAPGEQALDAKVAQYDVYPNPSVVQRAAFPYFVVVQSDQLAHYNTRVAMPLARLNATPASTPRRLGLTVEVAGEALVLAAHLVAAVPQGMLRAPVASLRSEAHLIIDALDAVVSGV
jgi:toxin CcdB